LAHHYPDVPLHGDFTTIKGDEYGSIDLLVGGTPCQSFSVAGLRGGLDDDRGNLALEFLRLAQRTRARWVVWENVPGVLSSNGGRDFGSILGGLVELGYGFAYRVLDAQFFGVAQRRRRVFVIGYLGGAARAAAVLFQRGSLSGDTAPISAKKGDFHGNGETSFGGCSLGSTNKRTIINSLTAHGGHRNEVTDIASGFAVPFFIDGKPAIRRITPIECERLQGFQDNFTRIPWRNKSEDDCPDGPRYKALGNSMAVPVMRWIGERIKKVEEL
jgi:DNA (cytosine-5)-methyltransferase 1